LRRRAKVHLPPRVESTQQRDTSPELSSGEEIPGESKVGENQSESHHSAPRLARWDESVDDDEADADDGEWIDEGVGIEGVAADLQQLEFHTDYVGNPEKRRRRWKLRCEALRRAVSAPSPPFCVSLRDRLARSDLLLGLMPHYSSMLSRKTDITIVLLAAPSHTGKLHSFALQAVCRDNCLYELTDTVNMISTAFAKLSARCRAFALIVVPLRHAVDRP
jgi:hypothetical protein